MINTSFWKGKKVFITGHTGFKGAWLSIWLHEMGADVCGYSLTPHTKPSLFQLANVDSFVQSVFGDIRDIAHLKSAMTKFNPEIVIHMAAQPLVRESYENPVDTYGINVMGTVNMLESVRSCQSVKVIINVTTDKVYKNQEWVWGYRETDLLGGYDPYSNSKACSEFVTASYIDSFFNTERYKEHGIAIATARAGNVIGGGDWAKDRIIPDIIQALENNEKMHIRNPYAVRPWQHVLEPLTGYLLLAEKLYEDGICWSGSWNFGPNIESTKDVKTLVETFEKYYNQKLLVELDIENKLHETSILKLDCTKAICVLNWKTTLNFEDTIRYTAEWYQNYQKQSAYVLCKKQIEQFQQSWC